MNRWAFALVGLICGLAPAFGAAPTVINVWPDKPLGENRKFAEEKVEVNKAHVAILHNAFLPTLTVYPAPADKDTGASVIICPGGGYNILAWDLEGTEVAEWLNSAGVTGIVLKYRVPAKHTGETRGFIPLMDAQRAISLVRTKAKDLKINPDRIGILGFSAGGNLAALACTNFEHRSYDVQDDIDKASCRPDFGVLIYPAYLLAEKSTEMAADLPISDKTPPIFFAHASDDRVPAAGSATMYMALKKAGVVSELHIYSVGGHGFGLRPTTRPCSTWPARCEEWLKSIKIIETKTEAKK